jgi:hypothetical protein
VNLSFCRKDEETKWLMCGAMDSMHLVQEIEFRHRHRVENSCFMKDMKYLGWLSGLSTVKK